MPELSMNEAAAKLHELAQQSLETPSEETTEPKEEPTEVESEETLEAVSEDQDVNLESEEPTEETPEVSTEPEADAIELEAEQLAEILNLKPEQLVVDDEGIKFKSSADGEDVDVNLSDLINAHQGERVLTNRSKEIAKLEQEQKENLNRLTEQSNQFARQATAILEQLKTKFVNPYNSDELKALMDVNSDSYDPGLYAARKNEIRDREDEFSQLVQNALSVTQQSQSTKNEELQRQYRDYLQNEGEKVLKAIPEWKTIEADVVKYALDDLNFSNEEIGQMADSRLLRMMYNSMQFEKGKQGAKQKKVRKVPKVVKSGNRVDKGQVSLEAAQKARNRLKESGSMEDAVAILKSRRT